MRKKSNRYQNQPWYIRLWRRRWYLMIPYWACRWYFKHPDFIDYSFKNAWGLATGDAQVRMQWWYDWDEVFNNVSRRTDRS